jgi:hypothetical protein
MVEDKPHHIWIPGVILKDQKQAWVLVFLDLWLEEFILRQGCDCLYMFLENAVGVIPSPVGITEFPKVL